MQKSSLLTFLKNHGQFTALLCLLALVLNLQASSQAAISANSSPGQNQLAEAEDIPAGLKAEEWSGIQAQIAGSFEFQAYLKPDNTGLNNKFGWAAAISGDTLVVGAPQWKPVTGYTGSAFVFVRTGGVWSQQASLKPSNDEAFAEDWFGRAVAISGDTILVGAMFEDGGGIGVNSDDNDNTQTAAGAVYVFVRDGVNWSQQAYLKASNTESNDQFGVSVGISGDTAVVGAWFEASDATGVNGDQSNNNLSTSGAAYVYVRSGITWSQEAYLKASNTGAGDSFGTSVAISGDLLIIGAKGEDSGASGSETDNSAGSSGAAYIFARSGTTWNQEAYLKASSPDFDDQFGEGVAIADNTAVIGARREAGGSTGVNGDEGDNSLARSGAAYVFIQDGTSWNQQAYLKASNTNASDNFGSSVSISGDSLVIGAVSESSATVGVDGDQTDNSAVVAGAAYVFSRSGTDWSQQAYLKASNTESPDAFGFAVSISGTTVVSGATNEDSNATGVNGDDANNSTAESGAAYVYQIPVSGSPVVVTAPADIVDFEATDVLTPVSLGTATVTDAGGEILTATADNTGPFPLGNTLVIWNATNSSGDSGSDDQLVNIIDTTDPVIIAPADVEAPATGDFTLVDLGDPVVTDNAGNNVQLIFTDPPRNLFPFGETTVTWTAQDASGNSSTDTQLVTVIPLDLDIAAFKASGRAKIGRGQLVSFTFKVKNLSAHPGDTTALATLVGMQNGVHVAGSPLTIEVFDPPGGPATNFSVELGEFAPSNPGNNITWTMTIADQDPDLDEKTSTTKVLR